MRGSSQNADQRAEVRRSRQILRRIEDYLHETHAAFGAQRENIGEVDIIYHPEWSASYLNYVAPRRKMAWVPVKRVEAGLSRLHELLRSPRFQYIDGLLPPAYAQKLQQSHIELHYETAIMAYVADDGRATALQLPLTEQRMTVEPVDKPDMAAFWQELENKRLHAYELRTLRAEPLQAFVNSRMVNVVAQGDDIPPSVARIHISGDTAHIVAVASPKLASSSHTRFALQVTAVRTALDYGCELIFAPGGTTADRDLLARIGFEQVGALASYRPASDAQGGDLHDSLEFSALSTS